MTSDPQYTAVAQVDDIPERQLVCFSVDGHEIVLCRVKDEFFCLENRCSHALSTFNEGRLRGYRLMCPLHGATFDVRDGQVCGPPAVRPIRSYAVRVEGDRLEVQLGEVD